MNMNNLVADPMCPYCHIFLEYDYTGDSDVDLDRAVFYEHFFCPCCQRKFLATSIFEFKGYNDVEELG